MAIGTISTPSAWVLRQVVTHTWCQAVQDNVNGWVVGTNTLKGVTIDGTGGASVTAPSPNGLKITASAPASTTAVSNTLTSANIPKAWGIITAGASPTIDVGFNMASVSTAGAGLNRLRITLAQALTSANYAVVGSYPADALSPRFISIGIVSSSVFDVSMYEVGTGFIDLKTVATRLCVVAYGLQ